MISVAFHHKPHRWPCRRQWWQRGGHDVKPMKVTSAGFCGIACETGQGKAGPLCDYAG